MRSPGSRILITVLVVVGLGVSTATGVFLTGAPPSPLPGVALGSEAILVVERIAMLFVSWLLALVVVARAVVGELPAEISGRGVRYADAKVSQDELVDSRAAIRELRLQVKTLADTVVTLEGEQAKHGSQLSRYAMDGEGHGH